MFNVGDDGLIQCRKRRLVTNDEYAFSYINIFDQFINLIRKLMKVMRLIIEIIIKGEETAASPESDPDAEYNFLARRSP